jgi:alanine transaminase
MLRVLSKRIIKMPAPVTIRQFTAAAQLTRKDVNKRVVAAQYAVRGLIPNKAEELREKLARDPESLPFDKIISANIGNPQQLQQKPLSFYREVLSILQNPSLLESDAFAADVKARAQTLLDKIGSVGAYSHSQGVAHVRKSVAHFITKRDDGAFANPNDIYLTTGASDAVKAIFEVLLTGEKEDGVMIPIPQYPLYTAAITLKNATPIPYFLQEEQCWSTDPHQIEQLVASANNFGIKPKILVVINPGNPTGAVLTRDSIKEIITVAAKHGLVIIADEVYQENVFEGEFNSFKSVLAELQHSHAENYDNVQLASLHSTSKGVSGECGQRGGYMELVGFKPEITELFLKLASISLCPVVTGQALVEMMVNPPKEGDESFERDQAERAAIHESYKSKAEAMYEAFSELENIEVQRPQGAMYLFPRIILNDSVKEAAAEHGLKPDEYYCLRLLEQTGICVVPGSGFGQVEGTYHVRTTFLPPGEEWIQHWANFHREFMLKFSEQ